MCKVIERICDLLIKTFPLLVQCDKNKLKFGHDILPSMTILLEHWHLDVDQEPQQLLNVRIYASGDVRSDCTFDVVKTKNGVSLITSDQVVVENIARMLNSNESFQFASSIYQVYLQSELMKDTYRRLSALPIVTSPSSIPAMLTLVEDHFRFLPFVGRETKTLGVGMDTKSRKRRNSR